MSERACPDCTHDMNHHWDDGPFGLRAVECYSIPGCNCRRAIERDPALTAADPLDPFEPLIRGLMLFGDEPGDGEPTPVDPMRSWWERFQNQIRNEYVKWGQMTQEQQLRLAFTGGWVARLLHELAETERQEVRA